MRCRRLVGAAQHQVDVRMSEQLPPTTNASPDFSILLAEMTSQISFRLICAIAMPTDGRLPATASVRYGLGAAIQRNWSVPAVRRSRADNSRVGRAVDPWPDRIGPGTRDR